MVREWRDDLILAVQRHATSKLPHDNLEDIQFLGSEVRHYRPLDLYLICVLYRGSMLILMDGH